MILYCEIIYFYFIIKTIHWQRQGNYFTDWPACKVFQLDALHYEDTAGTSEARQRNALNKYFMEFARPSIAFLLSIGTFGTCKARQRNVFLKTSFMGLARLVIAFLCSIGATGTCDVR